MSIEVESLKYLAPGDDMFIEHGIPKSLKAPEERHGGDMFIAHRIPKSLKAPEGRHVYHAWAASSGSKTYLGL